MNLAERGYCVYCQGHARTTPAVSPFAPEPFAPDWPPPDPLPGPSVRARAPLRASPDRLDPSSVAYLRDVEAGGLGHPGILARRPER
jgi:hypothetical protein